MSPWRLLREALSVLFGGAVGKPGARRLQLLARDLRSQLSRLRVTSASTASGLSAPALNLGTQRPVDPVSVPCRRGPA